MSFESQEVERKSLSILKILSHSSEPLGARVIARDLRNYGVELGERAVRYHLKAMDERGLTVLVGKDGRLITERGLEELNSALVTDKIGFTISRIEQLAFRTTFDWEKRTGKVPVNVTLVDEAVLPAVLDIMKPVMRSGWGVSTLVALFRPGDTSLGAVVPEGKVAIATVCSIVINGTLLKAGVPMDSRFGGILQVQNNRARRFVEVIYYEGSSMDPSEVFIRAGMTTMRDVMQTGSGNVLANFRQIPSMCSSLVEKVLNGLKQAKIDGVMTIGTMSESVCEMPVELNRSGMILIGGLNPVAAVNEHGIPAESHAMSTVLDYDSLTDIEEL